MVEKRAFPLAASFAILYIILLTSVTFPGRWMFKCTPLIILIYHSFQSLKGTLLHLLIGALLFCMTGDILLDINRVGNFKAALGAFFIGHLFYSAIFIKELAIKKEHLFPIVLLSLYMLAIYCMGDFGALCVPVSIYMIIIFIMGISALCSGRFHSSTALGAILFIMSDSVTAIDKFIFTIPYAPTIANFIYFSSQILLVYGITHINGQTALTKRRELVHSDTALSEH